MAIISITIYILRRSILRLDNMPINFDIRKMNDITKENKNKISLAKQFFFH